MDPDPGNPTYSAIILFESFTHIALQAGEKVQYAAFALSDFLSHFGPLLLVLVILLFLSAVVSSSEVAFFSLSQPEIEDYRESHNRTWDLLRQPRKLLATILIVNNLVNVGIIMLSALTLEQMSHAYGWDQSQLGQIILRIVEVGVITFILLFFGEITPKVYATQKRLALVRIMTWPLYILRTLFSPLSWLLIRSTSFIDNRVRRERENTSYEDIKHAIDLTNAEESPQEEKEILKGIVNFSSIAVKSIMRARVDVKAVEISTPFHELVDMVNDYGFSRIPVYEGNLDTIRGILHVKDLLPLLRSQEAETTWQGLLRDPYFVPESKKIDDLLDEFKARRLHIAIVVDEFGGTSGVVTLEDIIEEIFGEINDEFDEEELVFSKLSEYEYVFDGKIPLNDLFKITQIDEEDFGEHRAEADSLAGLILEIHGRIPEKGDTIDSGRYHFHIESVVENRIRRVKFVIEDNGAKDEEQE